MRVEAKVVRAYGLTHREMLARYEKNGWKCSCVTRSGHYTFQRRLGPFRELWERLRTFFVG
jgi:hypothetical protein